jgi:hypothetical protein
MWREHCELFIGARIAGAVGHDADLMSAGRQLDREVADMAEKSPHGRAQHLKDP